MLGSVHVLESPGPCCQIGHGFLGDVRGMVVEHDADDGVRVVVLIQTLEQADEFSAAVARLDFGDDLAGVQIEGSDEGQGTQTHILMVTAHRGMPIGHRR